MAIKTTAASLMLIGAFLGGLAERGIAQPQTEAESDLLKARAEAEQFEKEGEYAACAHAYQLAYERHPVAPGADKLVYNAAVCYQKASLVGRALQMYSLLETRFPRSRHSQRALFRRADLLASIARYSEAADAYERYVRRFGGEKDAPTALSVAIRYRIALGQERDAIAGIENFVKRYREKLINESALALLRMAALYESQRDTRMTIKTYQRYLREFGRKAGADRLVVVLAKLGELLWQQSCPGKEIEGSCLRIRPKANSGCGPTPSWQYNVVPRRSKTAREARSHFASALNYGRAAVDDAPDAERKAMAHDALDSARFYMIERGFETFLAHKPAGDLYFGESNDPGHEKSRARASMPPGVIGF